MHLTEQFSENNPTFSQFAQHLMKEAFLYLAINLTSGNSQGIIIQGTQDEKPSTQTTNLLKTGNMAFKSRKIRILHDFQKRKYGAAPTIIG